MYNVNETGCYSNKKNEKIISSKGVLVLFLLRLLCNRFLVLNFYIYFFSF